MAVRAEDDRKGVVIGNEKTVEKARQKIYRALGLDAEGRPPKKRKEQPLTKPPDGSNIVGGP